MNAKRKDKNGVLLRDGESQRKDGTYQYRYTNQMGKRITFYARTLEDLRRKEKKRECPYPMCPWCGEKKDGAKD